MLHETQKLYVRHGKRNTRLYRIWSNMKTRCFNSNDKHYKNWGGRGITVCNEWKNNFKTFYDWAMSHGYEDNLTIDRINNDGNYEPSNCRWVKAEEQGKNQRKTHLLTYNGETHSCREWEHILKTGKNTILVRYNKGWSVKDCLFGKGGNYANC